MVGRQPGATDSTDEFGFDESRSSTSRILGKFVPHWLARRAVSVSIRTDCDVYALGESVDVTVDFKNRLPITVEIPTPGPRLWGWTVDGELEASDQRRYIRDIPSVFRFHGGERKQVSFVWNGRLERTRTGTNPDGASEWILPEPGEHELAVYIATPSDRYQPRDTTTITIRG